MILMYMFRIKWKNKMNMLKLKIICLDKDNLKSFVKSVFSLWNDR